METTTAPARFLGRCKSCGTRVAVVLSHHHTRDLHQCPCGRFVGVERVKGVYNPDRVCDPRCTGAVGPKCSCECGGANHGAQW